MTKRNILLSLVFITVMMFGCAKSEQFGETISGQEITKISDILSQSRNYESKIVKVQGKIIQECPTGCWFNLKDKTGVLYIDIEPSGLAIPQKVGRKATVEGKVVKEDGRIIVIGKGVEIK